MNIFMKEVSYTANDKHVSREIARVLHSPEYVRFSSLPLNFKVELYPDRRGFRGHRGIGTITVPYEGVGWQFLHTYGGRTPRRSFVINNKRVYFEKGNKSPRADVLENIVRLPYVDPEAAEQQEQIRELYETEHFHIRTVQFGWECRDQVFSVEQERSCSAGEECLGLFDHDAREIRIKLFSFDETRGIAIRFSQMYPSAAGIGGDGQPSIFFALQTPPAYETEEPRAVQRQKLAEAGFGFRGTIYDLLPRRRHKAFDDDHARNAAFTSLGIRVICKSRDDLKTYRKLCSIAQLPEPSGNMYAIDYRGLFSPVSLELFHNWLVRLPFRVAFQMEALTRRWILDVREALSLRPAIQQLLTTKGARYTSSLIEKFAKEARALWSEQEESGRQEQETVIQCFARCRREFVQKPQSLVFEGSEDVFECLHVTVTPTSIRLDGPFAERSNRVVRSYPDNEDSFLRVSFTDEDQLQYRFNREVKGPDFIRRRVGEVLQGLLIGGRTFDFLAYSQSALKEHAVWFVKPFDHENKRVTAAAIIKGIGSFHDLEFDPELIFCPARYGARISQAFTATDASISAEAEEIIYIPDIEAGRWQFTDGVGTISRDLAQDIQTALYRASASASACMLSVDYKLRGRAVCIRPSMMKFNAPQSTNIEIARAFDRPSRYYLNRPLIMLLEGLGVPYETFKTYQDVAVRDAQQAATNFVRAAALLDCHGLGASFRLSSVLYSLDKIGVRSMDDEFYHRMMDFAIHHVLRELKQHARIPIPGGWTLVGVADVHRVLRPNEIFACVTCPNCRRRIYLEGPTVISRSPTIHPGDVQIVTGIGAPTLGSPFEHEPLANSVVFPVTGDRPLPSYLGGGDLDGDTYNVWGPNSRCECTIPPELIGKSLMPRYTHPPAGYQPAPKVKLPRPCTMADVGEFFMDYITSDVLGIIAINWLIIADQSEQHIFDDACIELAALHSDAVDYPKSGRPVPLDRIPRLKFKAKPDWNAPELIRSPADYYKSMRAIGRLFRDIELPAIHVDQGRSRRRRQRDEEEESTLEELLDDLSINDTVDGDEIERKVGRRLNSLGLFVDFQDRGYQRKALELFKRYASDLRGICAAHALSQARNATLTEEEVIIGTIVAKCSQPRKRKDLMSQMREQTSLLVSGVREEVKGEDEGPRDEWLQRAFVAWRVAIAEKETFGAKSFWWITLGAVFEAVKAIEEEDGMYDYQ